MGVQQLFLFREMRGKHEHCDQKRVRIIAARGESSAENYTKGKRGTARAAPSRTSFECLFLLLLLV